MLYSRILGTFLSKTRKKLQLVCCDLHHCLPVSVHSTNLLSFLPLLGTDLTSVSLRISLLTLPQFDLVTGATLKQPSVACI